MSSLSDTGSVFSAAANVETQARVGAITVSLHQRLHLLFPSAESSFIFLCVVLLNEYSYTHFNEIVLNKATWWRSG